MCLEMRINIQGIRSMLQSTTHVTETDVLRVYCMYQYYRCFLQVYTPVLDFFFILAFRLNPFKPIVRMMCQQDLLDTILNANVVTQGSNVTVIVNTMFIVAVSYGNKYFQ